MHGGQKLELRLSRSGFLSWVPLGETGLVPRSGVAVSLISRNRRSKMNSERKQSQNKTRSSLIRAGFDLEAVCYAGPVF